jgi:hypothetical protein
MDIVNRQREHSPLASLLLKPRRSIPGNDCSKPEPRFSLCEFTKIEAKRSNIRAPLTDSRVSTGTKSSIAKKESNGSVDKRVAPEMKSVSETVSNAPKAVRDSIQNVEKEIEKMKDRIQCRGKESIERLRAGREHNATVSNAEASDASNDGVFDSEKSEWSERSKGYERANRKRPEEREPDGKASSDSKMDSAKPEKIEMTKELLQLGRRDCSKARLADGHERESRIESSGVKLESKMTEKIDKGLETELQEMGKRSRPRRTENEEGGGKNVTKSSDGRTETGEKRSLETAFGSESPKVCSKTYKVDMSSCVGEDDGSKTYDMDTDGSETESTVPTLPTVIFRGEGRF